MSHLPTILALTSVILSFAASEAKRQDGDRTASTAAETEQAAMVLSYPHDQHVFGELPANLDKVPGAVARLTREADRIGAVFETRLTPGHVGKLLAVVINNPSACRAPTPATACGPHEEEFNVEADGGFYLGEGDVAGSDGRITVRITAGVGDTSNLLCGGAANPDFNPCARGFALRDPRRAEVTLVLLDNGLASQNPQVRAQQLTSPSPCPSCPPFTAQIAIGFGREPSSR